MTDKSEQKKVVMRRADPYDAVNIMRLMEKAHEMTGNRYPPINHFMMIDWINRVVGTGFVVVAEIAGRIVGSLGLGPYQYPWSDKWMAANEWLFVDPKYRKRGTAAELMGLASQWADKHNTVVIIGIQDILDAELKDEFVKQKGFEYAGGIFIRWPVNDESDEVADE